MNPTMARGLQVGSDDRSLTFTELDPTISKSFKDNNVLMPYIWSKPLANGASSADFAIFGESPEEPEHQQDGQFIESGTIANDKANIALDDPLKKALRLPMVDVDLSQWDLVSPYAVEIGRLMSEKLDKRGFRLLTLAARTAAVTNVHGGGLVVERSGGDLGTVYPVSSTGADNIAADFSSMALKADNANWPETGRVAFILPEMRQVITRSNRVMNRDYVNVPQQGSVVDRSIGTLEGWNLVVTKHLPSTNVTNDLSKYNGDFTYNGSTGRPVALFMSTSAPPGAPQTRGPVGKVQAGGMINKVWFDENRDCWLVKSRLLAGMGKVGVFLAGELRCKS